VFSLIKPRRIVLYKRNWPRMSIPARDDWNDFKYYQHNDCMDFHIVIKPKEETDRDRNNEHEKYKAITAL